jgi:hypothetical protein
MDTIVYLLKEHLRDIAKEIHESTNKVEWSNPKNLQEAWMFLTKYYLCKSIYNKLQS